jgi:hypothetical protein
MILGFAHLTYCTDRIDQIVERLEQEGFLLNSIHRMVPSSFAKWPLMARPARMHDLALMKGPLAIEIVGHDTGSDQSPAVLGCDVGSRAINLRVRDAFIEREFMSRALPCKSEDDSIEVHGAFPGWSASLRIAEDSSAPLLPPLDVEGFSCLAFYSNNLVEDCQRLVALGARHATEEFGITLDRRDLSIVMLRSPGGIIIELVRVKRQ